MNIVYYFSPMSLSTKNKDYVAKLKGKIPKLTFVERNTKDSFRLFDILHHGAKIDGNAYICPSIPIDE